MDFSNTHKCHRLCNIKETPESALLYINRVERAMSETDVTYKATSATIMTKLHSYTEFFL